MQRSVDFSPRVWFFSHKKKTKHYGVGLRKSKGGGACPFNRGGNRENLLSIVNGKKKRSKKITGVPFLHRFPKKKNQIQIWCGHGVRGKCDVFIHVQVYMQCFTPPIRK